MSEFISDDSDLNSGEYVGGARVQVRNVISLGAKLMRLFEGVNPTFMHGRQEAYGMTGSISSNLPGEASDGHEDLYLVSFDKTVMTKRGQAVYGAYFAQEEIDLI